MSTIQLPKFSIDNEAYLKKRRDHGKEELRPFNQMLCTMPVRGIASMPWQHQLWQ
jgi:hypothetical protein